MNLSTQTIPVLVPTKIRPPKGLFGPFGASQAGPHQQQQQILFAQLQQQQQQQQQSLPGQPARKKAASFRGAPPPAGSAPALADDGWQAVDSDTKEGEPTAIAEPTTVVHESPLALTYRIDGASRVPSDGVPHQLAVAVLSFGATLRHVAVPKTRPVAYLHAAVRNTSDYRLLAGPVHAFVDAAFAARTALPRDIAPGDTFDCTLGADPATRIRYARTSRRVDDAATAAARARTSAFSEQWASTAYKSVTTITNSHPFALRALILRDAVPMSEDELRVNVVLRRPAALADLEQGEELEVGADGEGVEGAEEGEVRPERSSAKRKVRWGKLVEGKGGRKAGLFEWVVDVGAGEQITIETEWDVKAPVSLSWVESV